MFFIVNLNDLSIVDQLIKKKIDNQKVIKAIIVGDTNFAMDIARNTSLKEIALLKTKAIEVYVRVNLMFDEIELESLKQYLIALAKLKIDLVLFQDFAVKQIVDNLNLDLKLSYDGSMINTNSNVLNELFEDNIISATISNELSLEEIKLISKNTKMPLLIQAHGFCLMSYSKRKLITNYKQIINDKSINKNYFDNPEFIYENTSKYNCPIIETKKACLIYSGYILDAIDYLDELNNYNINQLIINPIFNSGVYTMLIINSYIEALRFLLKEPLRYELTKQTYKNQFEMYCNYPLSHGFLHNETMYTLEAYRKHETKEGDSK